MGSTFSVPIPLLVKTTRTFTKFFCSRLGRLQQLSRIVTLSIWYAFRWLNCDLRVKHWDWLTVAVFRKVVLCKFFPTSTSVDPQERITMSSTEPTPEEEKAARAREGTKTSENILMHSRGTSCPPLQMGSNARIRRHLHPRAHRNKSPRPLCRSKKE